MSSQSPSFLATFAESLSFGHILEICGKVQQDADRISISFSHHKSSNQPNNEIHLQILLDFRKKQTTFTQFSSADTNNVVSKDLIMAEFLSDFKFYIMLSETKFYIALNNKPFVSLKYIKNFAKLQIQTMKILGKLEYLRQLDHHKFFPYIWPPIQITNDYLDFSNDQPMSFRPGHITIISACLQGNNKGRFVIEFRHARDNKRQELHVSVRFDTNKIIRNSKCRRADDKLTFGQEEIDDTDVFPFESFTKPFKLAVGFCETEFRVAKDGRFLFSYSYRSPNVLQFVMGPKIFGTNGLSVRVCSIEHLPLEDEQCTDLEKYSL